MLDHIFYGQIDEITPCNWIMAAGHTIIDFHVLGLCGGRSPGGGNYQIDDNIDRHHIAQIVLFTDDRTEEAIANG